MNVVYSHDMPALAVLGLDTTNVQHQLNVCTASLYRIDGDDLSNVQEHQRTVSMTF